MCSLICVPLDQQTITWIRELGEDQVSQLNGLLEQELLQNSNLLSLPQRNWLTMAGDQKFRSFFPTSVFEFSLKNNVTLFPVFADWSGFEQELLQNSDLLSLSHYWLTKANDRRVKSLGSPVCSRNKCSLLSGNSTWILSPVSPGACWYHTVPVAKGGNQVMISKRVG